MLRVSLPPEPTSHAADAAITSTSTAAIQRPRLRLATIAYGAVVVWYKACAIGGALLETLHHERGERRRNGRSTFRDLVGRLGHMRGEQILRRAAHEWRLTRQ